MTDWLAPSDPNMPPDLQLIERKADFGVDPDEIPGIERLWLYRFGQLKEEFAANQREFFRWLKRQRCEF